MGNAIKGIGIVQDFTERVRQEEELRRKDADLGTAQALAHIGSWRLDVKRNRLEWSDETYRIFGIEAGTPVGYEQFLAAIHPDDREKVDYAWRSALQGVPYQIEHRILVNGELKWVRENARLEADGSGALVAGVGTVQLITERKLYEEQLESLANYDPLTGLANRALLMSHLQNSIEQARRMKSQIALIMFDLDRFKDINDSYGHGAGDELLTLIFTMVWMMIMRQDNTFTSLKEIWFPLLAGFTLTLLMILAIDLFRLQLTGTWGAFPLGS